MTGTKYKLFKGGCGFFVLAAFLVAGCGPSQNKIMARKHLNHARAEYAKAEMDTNVTTYANDTLVEANNAIKAGDKALSYKEIEQQAYLAERKTQIAKTLTDNKLAGEDREALSREKDRLLFQTEQ